MKLIIGGSMAIILAMFGFGYQFGSFFKVLAGIIPISLLLGGCLALSLYREMKDDDIDDSPLQQAADPETDQEVEPKEQEPVEVEEAAPLKQEEANFIGNVGSMVFHTPDCQWSTGKNCTAFFGSREEALEAGYKACGMCKP